MDSLAVALGGLGWPGGSLAVVTDGFGGVLVVRVVSCRLSVWTSDMLLSLSGPSARLSGLSGQLDGELVAGSVDLSSAGGTQTLQSTRATLAVEVADG